MIDQKTIRNLALQNAVKFNGKSNPGAVIGHILGSHPEEKANMKEISKMVNDIIKEVNKIPVDKQRAELEKNAPELELAKESGCSHVIIGHSERRHLFKEPDEMINNRVKNAIKNGLHAIFCVGETLAEREKNKAFFVIEEQIKKGLAGISSEQMKNVIIAYEPVWAIGTGKNATPEQAQEIHVFIRDLIKKMFSEDISFKVRILYGGSVKPDNIKDLMMQSDIDGALVGGASLKSEDFCKIVKF
jgi:triosephosphate isomerase